ncbi:glycosyltransferase family 4 protein [Candidatus Bathyarchaeota archaeon]|nr:MAG: glycosyltransferase family 4 protein [Candidatus Bathyarchaeota archaeon]
MRVLQVTQRFPPAIGGVEQHVYHLSQGLKEAGIEVEVLTTDLMRDTPFERMDGANDPYPFPVTRTRVWKLFDAPHGLGCIAPSMLKELVKSPADVVHAHAYGYFPSFAASVGTALDHSVLVITPHSDAGRPSLSKSIFDRIVAPLTVRRAMRVIAVSQHEAAHLAALGVPVDRISVIPNGVDLGELDGLKGQRKGDRLRGIFVGRLDPDQKGLTTLFQALALLPSDLPLGVRLIGEDWGATEILRSLAERLGIRDKVAFVGRVDRGVLVNEYRDADFLVLPSLFEPFGIVLLEAMATGLPVVASRVGGIPEIVEQGRTGILVEPGNARALADALTEICHDENLRIAMGAEARVRAAAFDWKTITPRILSVYHQAMEER